MRQGESFQVDAEAARALADWKALFAGLVSEQAKQLSKHSIPANIITLAHYREAASLAVQSLTVAIQNSDHRDARQEAA